MRLFLLRSATRQTTMDMPKWAQAMDDLARMQDGFIGIESARSELGITVSYWDSVESIRKWKT